MLHIETLSVFKPKCVAALFHNEKIELVYSLKSFSKIYLEYPYLLKSVEWKSFNKNIIIKITLKTINVLYMACTIFGGN